MRSLIRANAILPVYVEMGKAMDEELSKRARV
jgi:hypothetical protein